MPTLRRTRFPNERAVGDHGRGRIAHQEGIATVGDPSGIARGSAHLQHAGVTDSLAARETSRALMALYSGKPFVSVAGSREAQPQRCSVASCHPSRRVRGRPLPPREARVGPFWRWSMRRDSSTNYGKLSLRPDNGRPVLPVSFADWFCKGKPAPVTRTLVRLRSGVVTGLSGKCQKIATLSVNAPVSPCAQAVDCASFPLAKRSYFGEGVGKGAARSPHFQDWHSENHNE